MYLIVALFLFIASSGSVITIAGKGRQQGYVDGSAHDARFSSPGGMTMNMQGKLFIADTGNHIIRMYDPIVGMCLSCLYICFVCF